jgi:phosphatidate phosphatase APP1
MNRKRSGPRRLARESALSTLRRVERVVDSRPWRRRPRRPCILPYRSYGTAEALDVRGRVVENRGLRRGEEGESRWKHLVQVGKRILSREIPGAAITATWNGRTVHGLSDDEGYFHLRIETPPDGHRALWEEVEVRVDGFPGTTRAHVLIPPEEARFGIVSDIDDTVIRTDATSLYRMLRTVLLENAHVRLPFEGVSAFYRELHADRNPLFYVSSGPWNLYDVIEQIFELREIPLGPLFLQDWGIDEDKFIVAPHDEHKREHIDTIVGSYPALPFILIGDSGQRDPEIYDAVARHYPGRILAIYIRDVERARRSDAVAELASALLRDTGVETILVPDTLTAARHALSHGWITESGFRSISGEKKSDEAAEQKL